jgi:hypothetical protein
MQYGRPETVSGRETGSGNSFWPFIDRKAITNFQTALLSALVTSKHSNITFSLRPCNIQHGRPKPEVEIE